MLRRRPGCLSRPPAVETTSACMLNIYALFKGILMFELS